MGRIECYGRITDCIESASLKDRRARKQAVRPTGARISGGRKANIGRSSAENTSHLECRHDGGPKSEGTRLDDRGVLAAGVGEHVRAEASLGYFRRGRRRDLRRGMTGSATRRDDAKQRENR